MYKQYTGEVLWDNEEDAKIAVTLTSVAPRELEPQAVAALLSSTSPVHSSAAAATTHPLPCQPPQLQE